MKLDVRAEDIMTPRKLLDQRSRDADAEKVADAMGFDAIPISRSDGKILEFWSRTDRRRIRIRRAHPPHTMRQSRPSSLALERT